MPCTPPRPGRENPRREELTTTFGRWVVNSYWSLTDAERTAGMVGRENAARVYQLA